MGIYAVAALLVVALATGAGGDRYLAHARWVRFNPRLGLIVWHATATAFVLSVVGTCALLAHDVFEHALMWALHADKTSLHMTYTGGRSVPRGWNVLAFIAVVFALMLGVALTRNSLMDRHRRGLIRSAARHGQREKPRAGHDRRPHTVVTIEHPAPAVFCVPGRTDLIVMTASARESLSEPERSAAIEHELAHLRRRHHRSVLVAESVSATCRRLGALRSYSSEVRRLVEMDADDEAVSRCGSKTVASALLTLSVLRRRATAAQGPLAGLAFEVEDAGSRIRRILQLASGRARTSRRTRTVRRLSVIGGYTVLTAAMLGPSSVILLPAATLVGSAH